MGAGQLRNAELAAADNPPQASLSPQVERRQTDRRRAFAGASHDGQVARGWLLNLQRIQRVAITADLAQRGVGPEGR